MSLPFYIPPVITQTRDDGTRNVFICQEKLGQGGFAVVYKVMHQNSNKIYAMKIISKQLLMNAKGKSSLDKLKNEIQIQKSLIHSNIVQSKISFCDDFNYYIALEYCPGKTISEYLRSTSENRLSEPQTRKVLKDVINGLIYIHRRKIIHYDLKLENFIIGSDGKVKIADFGLSTFLKKEEDKKNSTICGTPNYMSPEIVMKKDAGNSFASDIWAIGVAAYIMLIGRAPFAGLLKDDVYDNIKNCQFSFPPHISLSLEAKDFIKSILKLDPKKRPSALDLFKHPFMRKYDTEPIQLYQKVQSPTKYLQFNNDNEYAKNDNLINGSQISPQFSSPESVYGTTQRGYNNNSPSFYVKPYDGVDNSVKKSFFTSPQKIDQPQAKPKAKKNFTIPNNFVVKHSFLREDLVYLLGNGTVGICFGDKSRIVLSPNEDFAQYYKDHFSHLEIIDLAANQEISNSAVDEKISLVKKFARAFKKFKNLYEQLRTNPVSSIPLHHVSSFIKKDNSVLFKFSNKNIQVNFDDGKKMIIFWNSKKMCLSKNIKEKCILFGQNDISKMNANSDELKKYKKTKEMLNELAHCR
ncbi:hypothetical protein M9Y10_037520 [Tritrichomonas musculus]|uniref:Protein kinase domain-containing protein n=1 Tax=Tritrichomonas musculus TaxID=1915356 RepID=A0ABR2GSD9_9EUKA